MRFARSAFQGPVIRLLLLALACLASRVASAAAADQWIEVKSPNFTLITNGGERSGRKLAWQLEQIRSATIAMWSFAKPTLNRPLVIIAAKDEQTMRTLAPQYWEVRGGVRPASVWITGPDAHYLAIRTDVEVDTQQTVNPYLTAYHAYAGLVLGESLDRDLPLWFLHGFTEFLSNTIVREDHILIGTPLPWHLERLRDQPYLPLPKLVAITSDAPEITNADRRAGFDAETWALMHFLIFSDAANGLEKISRFTKLVGAGRPSTDAFTEAFGQIQAVENQFRNYIQKQVFLGFKYKTDATVDREKFPVRPVAPADSWGTRAQFHAVMRRPVEARAAIAEARKADAAGAAATYVAEGVLADLESNEAAARTAYQKAGELKTTNAWAYYRLAMLAWRQPPTKESLEEVESYLARAVAADNRYADAYAWLGEIRAALGNPAGLGLVQRAIAIEPLKASHRLRAARVLLMQGKVAEAKAVIEQATPLLESDSERQDARELLERIAKAGKN